MHSVKHWLHGDCEFNVIVGDEETRCRWCLHSHVCKHDMSTFCANMLLGCSGDVATCEVCTHRFTRYDDKQKIPCFKCSFFEPRDRYGSPGNSWREVWSKPNADLSWFRRGIVLVEDRQKVYETIIDNPDDSLGGEGCGLELIPLTKNEYEDLQRKIEEDGGSLLVNYSAEEGKT